MNEQRNKAIVPGVLLIALGVVFLLWQFLPFGGAVLLFLLGVGFLVTYFAWQRHIGFLIPGAILTGLSIATALWQGKDNNWPYFLVMLGLAFFAIWLFGTRGEQNHWPLWPGTILFVLGIGFWLTTRGVLPWSLWDLIGKAWPVVLIIIGLGIVLRWFRDKEPEHGTD